MLSFPLIITSLAAKAFLEMWPESADTRAISAADRLICSGGVSDEAPAVE